MTYLLVSQRVTTRNVARMERERVSKATRKTIHRNFKECCYVSFVAIYGVEQTRHFVNIYANSKREIVTRSIA